MTEEVTAVDLVQSQMLIAAGATLADLDLTQDSVEPRGETLVDSPEGGRHGFPAPSVTKEEILHSFFVPKLCNLCEHSPCVQVCPVGATFDAPDGAVQDPARVRHSAGVGSLTPRPGAAAPPVRSRRATA